MILWKMLFAVSEQTLIDYWVVISLEDLLLLGWTILKERGKGMEDFYLLHLNDALID
jgi:hypothetical protein